MRQAYGDEYLGKATVKRWLRDYTKSHKMVRLAPHGETKPSVIIDVNINTVSVAVNEDRHVSTRSFEAILHITMSIRHRILTDHLDLCHVSSTWVLHHLTFEQMEKSCDVCNTNLERIAKNRDCLSHIITCDESWVHYFNPLMERERVSSGRGLVN